MSRLTRRDLLAAGMRTGFAAAAGLAGGGALFAARSARAQGSGKKVTARLSHDLAADDPYNHGALRFAELVGKYTNGEIDVQVFPNHVLASEPEDIRQMRGGSLDLALIGGNLPSIDPRWSYGALPYLFKTYEGADKVYEGDVGHELLDSLGEFGLVGLSFFTNGYRHVTNSKRPIVKPKDMDGLKIRVPQNEAWIATFRALGANPTPMDFGQLYMALKTKVVDGQEGAASVILTMKFYEGQNYLALTAHIFQPVPLIAGKKFWDTLSKDAQEALRRAALESARYERGLVKEADTSSIEKLKSLGVQVSEVNKPAFVATTKPVYPELEAKIPGLKAIVNKIEAAQT